MRNVYIFKNNDCKKQVDNFINSLDKKVKRKFEFVIKYIADESNQFKEPYVKHFTIDKYKQFYELRLKASGIMVRIIFCNIEANVILLYAFIKKNRRDTEQALDYSLKLKEQFGSADVLPVEYLNEVKIK